MDGADTGSALLDAPSTVRSTVASPRRRWMRVAGVVAAVGVAGWAFVAHLSAAPTTVSDDQAWAATHRDALVGIERDDATIGELAADVRAHGLHGPAGATAAAVDHATGVLADLVDAVASGDEARALDRRDALHDARLEALDAHQDLERAMHRVGIGFHG
ncbi:hypothetical protein IC607_02195 [Cellulomonas sp. JH27-2]|uniref:hypothetical protein n=1 Tax=Cellulomonas sp. JH27-2 TaxID=2774139 RepID=UPI001784BEED|nr:hypothetical protein [Cellulomonas sp. JH27-2]MBD8057778.1 hypothetical protein [Cellulomonas sp. JH27-2]